MSELLLASHRKEQPNNTGPNSKYTSAYIVGCTFRWVRGANTANISLSNDLND